jgi:hypothetical protein
MRTEGLDDKRGLNVFVYLSSPAAASPSFLDPLRQLLPEARPEVFESLEELKQRLRRPKNDSSIMIVFSPSREDLSALGSVRDFLGKVHLLLVLPDQEETTLALAHRLLPSFISYVDSDFKELLSVVNKLWHSGQDEEK